MAAMAARVPTTGHRIWREAVVVRVDPTVMGRLAEMPMQAQTSAAWAVPATMALVALRELQEMVEDLPQMAARAVRASTAEAGVAERTMGELAERAAPG